MSGWSARPVMQRVRVELCSALLRRLLRRDLEQILLLQLLSAIDVLIDGRGIDEW